nr:MAG: hypothetical protein [Caudoviricetes sp.]
MFKENFKMSGKLNLLLVDSDGSVKLDKTYPNLVVLSGKEYVAQRMTSNNTAIMSSIAVGSDGTTPVSGDIALLSEIARSALTSANVVSNTVTYITTFLPGTGTGALEEAGIFNSTNANAGTMLCRTTFPVVNKESGDTFTITWNVSPN